VSNIVALSDPCPLPGGGDNNNINRGTASSSSSSGRGVSSLKTRKDSLLYAPMANVGRVTMDREGTYIELKHIHYTKREQLSLPDQYHLSSSSNGQSSSSSSDQRDSKTPADLLRSMQDVKVSLDEQLQQRRRGDGAQSSGRVLSMFANSSNTTDEKYDETDSYDDEDDDGDGDGDDDFDDEEEDEDDDGDDEEDNDDDDEDRNDDEDDDDRNDEEKQSSSLLLTSSDDRVYSKASSSSSSSRRPYDDDDSFDDPKRRSLIESTDLMLLVYGPDWTSNGPSTATRAGAGKSSHRPSSLNQGSNVDGDDDEDELFALPSSNNNNYQGNNNSKKNLLSSTSSLVVRSDHQYRLDNALDSSRVWTGGGVTATAEKGELSRSMSTSSSSSSLFDIVRRRCVTGGYGDRQIGVSSLSVSGEAVNRDDDDGDGDGEEGDQQYDAFEDLQTGEKFSGRSNKPNNDDDEKEEEDEEEEDEEDQERRNEIIDQELRVINARKKASFKASFDRRYDEKLLVSPR